MAAKTIALIGWLLTKQTMGLMLRGVRKTLPGLANFWMAGQWVEPGGSVPLAALSGRNAVQLICHQDRRPFNTATEWGGTARCPRACTAFCHTSSLV